MVEFLVTEVTPVYSLYRKRRWGKKVKGFEYAKVNVFWAFQEEVEINDIVRLHDKKLYVVITKEPLQDGGLLMLRLLNLSDNDFKTTDKKMFGEGFVTGKVK